jgi:hypothetical protein
MKYKIYFIILVMGISAVTFAQSDSLGQSGKSNLVSKKGIYILPQKGELALGIDAYPVFYYLGSVFSNDGATPPSFDYGRPTGIYGKYMLESDFAIRANFRFDFSSNSDIYVVPKSTLTFDPLAPQFVEDEVIFHNNYAHLGVGIEKLRGLSRVQGKYGAEIIFGYLEYTTDYNYGNSITNQFNTPETYSNIYENGSERILSDYVDKGFYTGVRGFLGIEFFIGPKISLGGEFGYSFFYQWSQNRIRELEYWDGTLQEVSTIIKESTDTGYDDVGIEIDNLDGAITLFFYF